MLKTIPILIGAMLSLAVQFPTGQDQDAASDEASLIALENMQGAWKVTRLDDPSLAHHQGLQHSGYALIAGGYMSVEIHVGWPENGRLNSRLRSGTHRITMLAGLRIRLTSLIGSFADDSDFVRAEPPGRLRNFRYIFAGDRLTLVRDDGYEIQFARMTDPSRRVDIYGRPIPGDDDEGDGDEYEKPRRPLRKR